MAVVTYVLVDKFPGDAAAVVHRDPRPAVAGGITEGEVIRLLVLRFVPLRIAASAVDNENRVLGVVVVGLAGRPILPDGPVPGWAASTC